MNNSDISRREVLNSVGAAGLGALTVGTGSGAADETTEYNVGTESPTAEQAARDAADKVIRVLDWEGDKKTVTGTYTKEAVDKLDNRPDVRYTEVNGEVEAIGTELNNSWGVDRVDAEVAHANDSSQDSDDDGDGDEPETGGDEGHTAHIAIIDTGIDGNHSDLDANVGAGKAFVDCGSRTCGGPPCSTSNCNHNWSDDHDHGTHCAGIAGAEDNSEGVVGVSTEATLHAVKVLDCNGCGSYSDVAAGIRHVADQGWDVGSMSLGGSDSSTMKDACNYAYNNGVLLVAAAGNDGPCTDCVGYPAAYTEVIAVSAIDKDDSLASYSSTGPEVELAAPGTDVYSTVIGGYDTFSGTSMACPHVAGTGGQLMANGFAHATDTKDSDPYPDTPGGARGQLQDTAEDIGLSSNEQGNGLVDVEAALGLAELSVDSLSASEVETSDDDAEFDVSWSVSDPDGNLDTVDLVLQDTTAGTQDDSETISVSGDKANGTTRLVASGDEGSGNSYDVTATVTDADGNTASKTVSTSETEDAPSVDSLSLSEVETSDSDAEFDADWSVSDNDGDLASVDLALKDKDDGESEDSTTVTVSGDSASGTTRLVATGEDGSGHTYEVTATVSDTDGTTSSATATATEGESSGSSSDMYVYDPTFDEKSYGPGGSFDDLMTTVTIQQDSDADGTAESSDDPVENATVDMTLSVDTNGDGSYDDGSWSFSGDTDSNGQIEFTLKKASDGDYKADITSVTHSTYSWDSSLDVEEPDYYCNFPGGSEC